MVFLKNTPGPNVKEPKGIRDIPDFMIAHKICPDYIHEVYEYQTEIALERTLPFGTPGKLYKIISI